MEQKAVEINSINDVILDNTGISSAYFSLKESIAIDNNVIKELKAKSLKNKMDIRLCLHVDSKNDFHNMIIVQHRDHYYPPHKHPFKAECYHLIEGELGAIHYDELGNITKKCRLGNDDNFIYRIAPNEYHVVFPISEMVVYHESKPGPFTRSSDFIEPDWSPNLSNSEEIERYTKKNHRLFAVSQT
jgi:cupin fold WbuC family metalloprotein